jgi:hypothetical protein
VNVTEPLHWVKRFDEAGLDASEDRDGKLRVQTTPEGLRDNQALFDELMHAAVTEYED